MAAIAAMAVGDSPVTDVGSLKASGVGLTLGPDGALWHTSPRAVGSTTLGGTTTETDLAKDADARAITTGPDGALWFVHDKDAIARVAPGGDVKVFDDLAAEPLGITAGPDGNLWYPAKDPAGKGSAKSAIARLTPEGVVTIFGGDLKGRPKDIVTGPDGALWFTEPDGRVGRVTTDGKVTEFAAPGRPTSIAAGSDGALWYTDALGSIGRVATDGSVTTFANAGTDPGDIAAGPDGALWYTLDAGFGRITTAGTIKTWTLENRTPVSIAAGPESDDAMYFTDATTTTLGRIDISKATLEAAIAPPTRHARPLRVPGPRAAEDRRRRAPARHRARPHAGRALQGAQHGRGHPGRLGRRHPPRRRRAAQRDELRRAAGQVPRRPVQGAPARLAGTRTSCCGAASPATARSRRRPASARSGARSGARTAAASSPRTGATASPPCAGRSG